MGGDASKNQQNERLLLLAKRNGVNGGTWSCACAQNERNLSFWKKIFKKTEERRMVGAGRDLRRSSSPTPLLKQGRIELVAQYIVVRF